MCSRDLRLLAPPDLAACARSTAEFWQPVSARCALVGVESPGPQRDGATLPPARRGVASFAPGQRLRVPPARWSPGSLRPIHWDRRACSIISSHRLLPQWEVDSSCRQEQSVVSPGTRLRAGRFPERVVRRIQESGHDLPFRDRFVEATDQRLGRSTASTWQGEHQSEGR